MENRLNRGEDSLSWTQRIAHIGDWEWEIATNVVYWSDELYRIYGFEPREIVPDYGLVIERVHPDSMDEFLKAVDAALNEDQPFEMDYRFFRRDGTEAVLHAVGEVIRKNDGSPVRMVGIVQDITGSYRAEKALRESEERLRLTLGASGQGLYDLNLQTGEVVVNSHYAQMLGYDPESFQETLTGCFERLHPDEVELVNNTYNSYIAGDSPDYRLTCRLKTKSGDWIWIESLGEIVEWDAEGKPLRMVGTHTDITERRQAEERLRKSERQLSQSQEIAMIGSWIHDVTKNTIDWSDEVFRRFDRDPGSFRPSVEYFADRIHPDDREAVLLAIREAVENDRPYHVKPRIINESGREWVMEAFGKLEKDANGKPLRLAGTAQDITERKVADEELRESEANLRRAQHIGRLGSWSWDVATNKLVWSDQVFRIYGLDPERDEPSFDIVINTLGAECRERFMKAVQVALEKDEPFEGDYCLFRPDGTKIYTHTAGEVTRDEQGNPLRMFGVVQDITERKQEQEELQRITDFLNETGRVAKVGGWEIDIKTMKMRWTDAVYEIHELDKNFEPTLDSGIKFYPPEVLPLIQETVRKAIDEGVAFDMELPFVTATGKRLWVRDIGKPSFDDDGKVIKVGGTFQDISISKQAEQEREKMQEQLLQMQKLESIGRLAGGIAHDFNNMLQAIMGNIELSLQDAPPESQLRENLEDAKEAATHSVDLTRQLLAFASKQMVSPRVLDLNETVKATLKMLRRLIGENINLKFTPGNSLWPVRIDPAQVSQTLANLCVNARDAIAGTGNIAIKSENVTIDTAFCENHMGFTPGPYVMLEVSDDGAGIEKEVLEHLFEPFFTTRGEDKGTGLGLAIVYGIVKQSGGFVEVHSKPGAGATFNIYLPRHASEIKKPDVSWGKKPSRGHGETVLLVEDNAAILKLSASMLDQLGYKVVTAATPAEAIRKATEDNREIRLLITDIIMPEMNGKELAETLMKEKPDLKCLFMSGYTADILDGNGVSDTDLNFMQKPFSIDVLAAEVQRLLD